MLAVLKTVEARFGAIAVEEGDFESDGYLFHGPR